MTDTIQKAVIYCRVSSRSQEEEGHGLESQELRCRQHAATKCYEVAAVFPDTFTGKGDFMQRPGMVALLSFLDAQPDENFVVIFDDLKRYARDTEFHLALRRAMAQRGATRECLNYKFDDTPEGKFVETIFAAQGQLEREQNGRQVAQKMKARMQNGYWIHNPPVGYQYTEIKGRGKMLLPKEPFASIVREAFEGYASGRFQTQAEVKRFFETFPDFPRNKYGLVKHQRVTDILTQPVYAGYICSETYNIHWLKAQHEGLISMETFDQVQERRRGFAKAPKRKNIGNDFALRGIVVCGDCNVPLRSSWSKGRSARYPYYLCHTKSCESYGKSIQRDKLEGEVGEIIKTLQPAPSLFTAAKAMFRWAWDHRIQQADALMHSVKNHIRDTDKQIEKLLTRIMEATNDKVIGAYENKISELERNKHKWHEQLEKITAPKGSFEEKLEPALTFLANPYKLWVSGQITLQRAVLKLAFAGRIIYHRNEGARTAQIALPFKGLQAFQGGGIQCGAEKRT